MVDKLWYEKIDKEDLYIRTAIQEYIDLYFFDSQQFKVVEDINLENLGEFLKVILRYYEIYHFSSLELYNITETLEYYFMYRFYKNEEGDIVYTDEYNSSAAVEMFYYLQMKNDNPIIFAEDVPYLIEFLHTKHAEITKAQEKLDIYFSQFHYTKRYEEYERRWEAITKERQQAIAENKPLPIRPMSIELSKCLKD